MSLKNQTTIVTLKLYPSVAPGDFCVKFKPLGLLPSGNCSTKRFADRDAAMAEIDARITSTNRYYGPSHVYIDGGIQTFVWRPPPRKGHQRINRSFGANLPAR